MRIAALALVLWLQLACTPFAGPSGAGSPATAGYRPQPAGQRGGTAVLTDFEYPTTLNPLAAATDLELRLGGLVFSPLWGFDNSLRPYPGLVSEVPTTGNGDVKVAADGRSMTVDVKLSRGLRWSDGRPLTADDVIFTLQAVRDPATAAMPIEGLAQLRRVTRRSESELTWTFDGVYAPYLELGAGLFVMPAHRLSQVPHRDWSGDPFFQHPDVASGPFAVSESVAGDRLVFDATPQPQSGPSRHRAYLDRIVFKAQSGKAAEMAALRAGAADLGFHLLPDDLVALRAMGSSPLVLTGLREESLYPNHGPNAATGSRPPWLDDRRVLDALDLGIDRARIVQDVEAGAGAPARGVFPRALPGLATGSRVPSGRNLEAARRLLGEAGWTPGADGIRTKDSRRLEISLLGICGGAGNDQLMQLLRGQWQEAGVAVSTSCLARDAFIDASSKGAFDITLASDGWGPDPNDWARAAGRCPDPALEQAFRRGASTLDPGSRRAAYLTAEREWLAYHCTLPLFEVAEVRQVSPRLHNYLPSPGPGSDSWNAADWWLSPPSG